MTERWRLSAFGDEIAWTLEEQAEALAACSIRYVELRSSEGVSVVDLGPAQLAGAAAVLREAGLGVSAIASPVGKAPIDGDPEEEWTRLRGALQAAHALSTPLVRVFSFYVEGRYEATRDEVLRRLAAMAREAEAAGCVLIHENESYLYGDTPERCRDLVESIGSPALRVVFDPANFVQVGARPVPDAWQLLRDHVAHVHVKDAVAVDRGDADPYPARVGEERLMESVRPAGDGDGHVAELLTELAASGYDGFLTLEPHLLLRFPELDGRGRLEVASGALRGLLTSAGLADRVAEPAEGG
jgi:sugar phosphate isomerase/epimerase